MPERYRLMVGPTGEVQIWWTDSETDAHPNQHRVGPRKPGPARDVPLCFDRIKQGVPFQMANARTNIGSRLTKCGSYHATIHDSLAV